VVKIPSINFIYLLIKWEKRAMRLSNPKTTLASVLFVSNCLMMTACQNKESTDALDNGKYPITHPERVPKSIPQTIEKPDVEDEFFEAEKLK
jgi:hypothetical protein